jgi:hypothetical protein
VNIQKGTSMLEENDDRSFWLELEAASKGLSVVGDKGQAERLKELFEELAGEDQSGAPDRITTRTI